MEKYILQILENNSRVIVPEFGAFIIKQKNPLIIVFNEFLQYNDGVLVDAVAKNEGTDRDSAKKNIDAFVKEINSQLDKGNPFLIEQLGSLVKSSTGKISLEKDTSGKVANAKKTEKKPVASKSAIKEPKEASEGEKKDSTDRKSPPEIKKEVKKEPAEIVQKEEDKKTKEAEPSKEKPEEIKQVKKEEPKSSPLEHRKTVNEAAMAEKEESKPPVQKTVPKKTPEVKTTKSEKSESTTKATGHYTPRTAVPVKEKKNRRKTNIWLWVIIILVVNGFIVTYFIMSDQLSGLFSKPEELQPSDYRDMTTDTEAEKENDILIIEPEEQTIEEESVVPVQSPKPKPVVTGKKYYIVAGVFREEQNADNLVLELRNQGYNSEKFGKIGNLHAVSFGVYASMLEAEQEMQRIKQEVNPEAWIKVMH